MPSSLTVLLPGTSVVAAVKKHPCEEDKLNPWQLCLLHWAANSVLVAFSSQAPVASLLLSHPDLEGLGKTGCLQEQQSWSCSYVTGGHWKAKERSEGYWPVFHYIFNFPLLIPWLKPDCAVAKEVQSLSEFLFWRSLLKIFCQLRPWEITHQKELQCCKMTCPSSPHFSLWMSSSISPLNFSNTLTQF